MKHTWVISETDAGERLDVFLSAQLPDKTRSSIAKLLKYGAGTVNSKSASVHRFLKKGDEVIFDDAQIRQTNAKGMPKQALHVKPHVVKNATSLNITEETSDWLVINKPAGLLVHPDGVSQEDTLADLLVTRDPAIGKVGEDPSRPGIMHRLDKDVSGLMVIAKTQSAFDDLKRQFAEHSVDKRYLALIHGDLPNDEDDIKLRIARSKSKARMAARPEHEKAGKAAWTHYKVIRRYDGAALVELNILSGRTHQIRAHMHGIGHPVIGDTLYVLRQTERKVNPPRLMLQSVHLAFKDPTTGEQKHFSLPPDPAFEEVMKTFKPHAPRIV